MVMADVLHFPLLFSFHSITSSMAYVSTPSSMAYGALMLPPYSPSLPAQAPPRLFLLPLPSFLLLLLLG